MRLGRKKKWEGKFWGMTRVSVVNTHSYLSILLWDQHNVGYPLRVFFLRPRIVRRTALYLFYDLGGHIGFSYSQFMLYWQAFFYEGKLVHNNVRIQLRHILV